MWRLYPKHWQSKKNLISKLIAVDQTAHVKGGYIGKSVRVINDLTEYIEREGSWFYKVYQNTFIQSYVINNWCSTGYFDLGRRTKEDPLSAHLLILVFEILLIQIRQDKEVTWFTVDGSDLKLTCFADDGYFFVKNVTFVEAVLRNFNTMFEFSSLKIKLNKYEACWLGTAKNRCTKPIDCRWVCLVSDSVRILGSYVSYDKNLTNKLNFLNCTKSIHQLVKV